MYQTTLPDSSILEEQRMPFRLPDFTRVIWASGEPREFWESKIRSISNDWLKIERLSVLNGIRDSVLSYCRNEEVPELKKWCSQNGLELVLLESVAQSNSYSSYGGNQGKRDSWRVAITRKEFVGKWGAAWSTMDNDAIGELLGYPKCCREFFDKYWVEEQYRDLTYPAFANSNFNADGPIECNILGRWVGVRWVSHMPCSFQCEESQKIGEQNRELAKQSGFLTTANLIDEVLSWKMRYSALNGILEIKTPVYKISAATESTPKELIIERDGKQPDHKASGIGSPFENKRNRTYTDSKRFKESLSVFDDPWMWEGNGFSSKEAMQSSHQPLVDVISEDKSVFDYGAGNGILIDQLRIQKNCKVAGVELDANRAQKGIDQFKDINLTVGDMFDRDYDSNAEQGIVMVGRLTETTKEKRDAFLNMLLENHRLCVFYTYGDWKDRLPNIDEYLKQFEQSKKLLMLDSYEDSYVTLIQYQILT